MEPLNKEKRIKREIANSNERRRMQSINAGFQKLKRLLPVNDGEKISKANILQHAADFITNIERDRIMLAEQNTLFRHILLDLKAGKIDLESALSPIEALNANSMLSVPLKLTMADLDSQNTTPASTPTPTPSTPTGLEATLGSAETPATISSLRAAKPHALTTATTTPTLNLNTTTATITTTITASNIPSITSAAKTADSNTRQSTRVAKSTRTPRNPYKITSKKTKSKANNNELPIQGNLRSAAAAKAAIALPLEVPYTTEVVMKSANSHHHPPPPAPHHNHQRPSDEFEAELMAAGKMLKTNMHSGLPGVGGDLIDEPGGAESKGQTLDTICKAIMKIEGDRVFKNEKLD